MVHARGGLYGDRFVRVATLVSDCAIVLARGLLWPPPGAIMVLEGVPEMTGHSTRTDRRDRGRFSDTRKAGTVLRPTRGEDLDTLARRPGVAATWAGVQETVRPWASPGQSQSA